MLYSEPVSKETIDLMIATWKTIFPNDKYGEWTEPDGTKYNVFTGSVAGKIDAEYFFVYDDCNLVGIYGFYREDADKDSCWLGWFGVLPEWRRRHYGTRIFDMYTRLAGHRGFRFARLYTGRKNNDAAIKFYESCGCHMEEYDGDTGSDEKLLIGTYVVFEHDAFVPWHNRPLEL